MSTAAPAPDDVATWDQHLEVLMDHAGRALDEGDFVEALDRMSAFTFPAGGEALSVDRLDALKRQHDVLGERMRRAQQELQASMGKSGTSRKAVRAYGRR